MEKFSNLKAALEANGIEILDAKIAQVGRVFTSAKHNKYYGSGLTKENGVKMQRYFLPAIQGRNFELLNHEPKVLLGLSILSEKLKANFPCAKCGGSGTYTNGRMKGVCFSCSGEGTNKKYYDARSAIPTNWE